MLPPSFFDHFEDRLNLAVYDTNQDHRMGLADIKARLAHIAGIENLTVEQTQGKEIYHLGEQTVEIPPGNAGVRNRVQFLAGGLSASPDLSALARVDNAVSALVAPIEAPIADPIEQPKAEINMSAIDRLKEKALRARNIAPDAIKKFEADLDGLISQEGEIENKRIAAVSPHQEAIAGVKGELDGLKSAIDVLSNGGPEL